MHYDPSKREWTEEVNGVHVPIQYDLRKDPWRMLVACMLMNRAGGHQAKEALERMDTIRLNENELLDWTVLTAFTQLEWVCAPCGFQRQRAKRIIQFTWDWHMAWGATKRPAVEEVANMHGVGQYALDSYKIFVMGEFIDDPSDHVLKAFVHSELFPQFASSGTINEDT